MSVEEIAVSHRTVASVHTAQHTVEGGGFIVQRPFPTRSLDHFDPFLLLDEGGPIVHEPGDPAGLPDHPHRGFETFTYFLEGSFEGHDSTGFSDIFETGDIEWTTAGRGIIHGGGPSEKTQRDGGRTHVFQLWVNLSRAQKMIPPQTQRVPAAAIPVIERDGVTAKIIAGEAFGVSGPIQTTTPILYLDLTIKPGSRVEIPVPEAYNSMSYVYAGEGNYEGTKVARGQLALFHQNGNAVGFTNDGDTEMRALLIAGQPLNEPVARYGPFVMNTRAEIMEAINDYEAGLFGR